MGTRCLTVFIDESGREIATLYRQFDGYLTGHGARLAEILKGKHLVNGFSPCDEGKVFNGAGDLAAAVIALLKIDSREKVMGSGPAWDYVPNPNLGKVILGGFYILAPGTRDCGEEWTYFLRPGKKRADGGNEISVGVKRGSMERPIYSNVARFVAKVEKAREMEESKRAARE